MAVNKLDETAALAGGDLDVGDFTEALEERSELILGDVARQPTNKDGGVVGVSELVHLSGRVVTTIWEPALHGSSSPHGLLRNAAHHGTASVVSVAGTESLITAVLGRSGRDSHRSVTAVNTLHLNQSSLLVVLVGESNETIASALARHGVRHDLCGLARGESSLEQRNQDIFVDLGTKIANEDAVLRATVVTSVDKSTARGPVKLELTRAVGHRGSIKAQCLGRSIGGGEFDKTVTGITRVLVTDHLDIDSLTSSRKEDTLDEVLVHPRLELAHPEGRLRLVDAATRRGRNSSHVRGGGGSVGERHF